MYTPLSGGNEAPLAGFARAVGPGLHVAKAKPAPLVQILVPGFCRALRDPFPPARISAIAALGVTAEYYDLGDIATKILPSIVCAAIDPEKARTTRACRAVTCSGSNRLSDRHSLRNVRGQAGLCACSRCAMRASPPLPHFSIG
jgi:hypothetical protein